MQIRCKINLHFSWVEICTWIEFIRNKKLDLKGNYWYLILSISFAKKCKKKSVLKIPPLFFTGSRLQLPLKRPGSRLLWAVFINFFYWLLLRLPLKRLGSRLLKVVFRGFYRLCLWLPQKRLGSESRILGAFFINFFYRLLLPQKRPGPSSPTLVKKF